MAFSHVLLDALLMNATRLCRVAVLWDGVSMVVVAENM